METIINNGGELEIGDVGAAVKELQDWLTCIFMSSDIQIDGYFGVHWWNTPYPTDYVLDVDGIVGPMTYTVLRIIISGGDK